MIVSVSTRANVGIQRNPLQGPNNLSLSFIYRYTWRIPSKEEGVRTRRRFGEIPSIFYILPNTEYSTGPGEITALANQ